MKMFISDLDKTLLNSQHVISIENEKALKELIQKGYYLAIASGRSCRDIELIMYNINMRIPIISLNGALIVDENKNIISRTIIKDIDFIVNMINFCEEKNLIYQIYTAYDVYSRKYENMMNQLYQLSKTKYNEIDKIINSMQVYYNAFYKWKFVNDSFLIELKAHRIEILKFEIISKDENLLRYIKSLVPASLTSTSSSPRNIEIFGKGINKGVAIQQLAEYFELDLSSITAIGDNMNDLEMLTIAGTSIAMGNAEKEIKDICTLVTTDYEEDGFAYAIYNLLK